MTIAFLIFEVINLSNAIKEIEKVVNTENMI